jgi:predicted enzyme related to lactoylglutathione lyase
MANPVVWFEVIGKDGNALRSFYADMFGWSYDQPEGMDYGMVNPKETGIGGGIGTGQEGAPPYQTFYVGVDDVEAALQQAESLGGSRTMGPMDIPMGGTIGMFTDPEGHLVGVAAGFGDQPG